MGNSPLTSLRHSDGDHSISYDIRLGGSAAINFPGRKVERDANGVTTEEAWQVSYKVDNSTCNLTLTKTKGKIDIKIADDKAPKDRYNFSVTVVTVRDVEITGDEESNDRSNSSVTVQTAKATSNVEPNATSISFVVSYSSTTRNPITVTATAQHGVTETTFDLYGNKRRRGFMVCEWKKKCKDDENAYMGTVTHYYANKEKDVGLSLAIKRIRVSDDGHLDFAVEGPQQHPVRALFYMFDEVDRTRTWKPTDCPHCANDIIQWQLASFEQFESEDSDDRPNSGGIVANNGRFEGNYNGNLIVRNLIVINRH